MWWRWNDCDDNKMIWLKWNDCDGNWMILLWIWWKWSGICPNCITKLPKIVPHLIRKRMVSENKMLHIQMIEINIIARPVRVITYMTQNCINRTNQTSSSTELCRTYSYFIMRLTFDRTLIKLDSQSLQIHQFD